MDRERAGNLNAERVENKWKSLNSHFLAEQDYNEGTGMDGLHKTFDYDNEVIVLVRDQMCARRA